MRNGPTEPLKYTTLDGEDRSFLLTLGALRRVRYDMAKVEQADGIEYCLSLIFNAQYPWPGPVKDRDAFADLFPANLKDLMEFATDLQAASGLNPNPPTAEVATLTPSGSAEVN